MPISYSLGHVRFMQTLAEERHHRVFVVDDEQRAVGIVTLTDILLLASDAYRAGMALGLQLG